MAVAATTKMDEFQPENESIEAYLERIEIYFDVNGVADDKKVSVFLNALGGKTYTLLRNLLAPAKLNTKSLNDLRCVRTGVPMRIEPHSMRFGSVRTAHKCTQIFESGFNAHSSQSTFICGFKSIVTELSLGVASITWRAL